VTEGRVSVWSLGISTSLSGRSGLPPDMRSPGTLILSGLKKGTLFANLASSSAQAMLADVYIGMEAIYSG